MSGILFYLFITYIPFSVLCILVREPRGWSFFFLFVFPYMHIRYMTRTEKPTNHVHIHVQVTVTLYSPYIYACPRPCRMKELTCSSSSCSWQ
ncbi:hypothetical protein V8C37DRAFT_381985 [Trichoderma ceciliae]